jgi:hypothetical protein
MKILLPILLVVITGCIKVKTVNNVPNNNGDQKNTYSPIDNKLLIGTWVEHRTEWRDGSNLDGNGNPLKWNSKWEFRPGHIALMIPIIR